MSDPARVGLVLAGGGARGAYEAGALSVLLPELEARGERPQLLVGTSVGAINAAFAGASAHLPAEQAVAIGLERWRAVRQREVVRSILGWQAPITALRYAAQVAGVPGIRLPSLLDPAPLVRNLRSWIDWQALHANVEADRAAVVVVATAIATGRSVAFAETHELKTPRSRRVMYVNCRIELEHVRASAAIPILFPPVHVESPRSAAGWYVDGGTRLNTPIKPAIDLGADRLVVLATDALSGDPRPATDGKPPDFGDGALQLLQGMLIDPLIEDLRTLGEINLLLASAAAPKTEESLIDFRAAGGKHPYRPLPCLLVAPREPGAIGRLAADVFHRRSRAQLSLSGLDIRVLDRLLGTDTATHGDLLSYLLFDPDFISELIAMGGDDARAALGKWTITPPPRGDAEPAGHPAFGR